MPITGTTAVIVPILAADPLLATVKRDYPEAVRDGIAAHVTLLYPFVPYPDVTDETLDWLKEFAASHQQPSSEFTEVGVETGFVYLAAKDFKPLAQGIWDQWPAVIPYGGRFGPNPPTHLTVAMGVSDNDAQSIAATARKFLPMTAGADQLWLVTFQDGWQVAHTFPFAS